MDQVICLSVGMMQTNCCIVKTDEQHAIVIDPGADADRILATAAEAGLSITAILLTHGHFDHILAAEAIRQASGAKLYVHTLDVELLADPIKNLAGLHDIPYQPIEPDVTVEDGDVLEFGNLRLEVLHTPGHTKGSVVYKSDSVLYCGDTLFTGSCGRTDLYGGDYKQILSSLARLAKLEGDYRTISGHGMSSTLEREKRLNPYLKEATK